MVSLMGLSVRPRPVVLAWSLMVIVAAAVENRLLRLLAKGGSSSRRVSAWASVMRVLITTIYALAALVLIAGAAQASVCSPSPS